MTSSSSNSNSNSMSIASGKGAFGIVVLCVACMWIPTTGAFASASFGRNRINCNSATSMSSQSAAAFLFSRSMESGIPQRRRQSFLASLSTSFDVSTEESEEEDDEEEDEEAAILKQKYMTMPLYGRYYQLEQLEEDHSILTEVFLEEDGSIRLGHTDGPRFKSGWGMWREQQREESPTMGFAMSVTQQFEGGSEPGLLKRNKIGVFPFNVDRTFVGERTIVGGKLAMTGKILIENDDEKDIEIGYFHLIDTTEERGEQSDE